MPKKPTAILLLHSPDQRGLVARISEFVFQNGGNIVHADHHIDTECGLFLMRVEWELDGFQIPRDEIASAFKPIATKLALNWELQFSDYRQRMAIMVSKYDHCLYDLLLREVSGELPASTTLIIGNHPEMGSAAARFQIPFFPAFDRRAEQGGTGKEGVKLLAERKIDLIVLARYMQILSHEGFLRGIPTALSTFTTRSCRRSSGRGRIIRRTSVG